MEAAQTETAQLDGEVSTLRARLPLLQQSIHAGEAEAEWGPLAAEA